MTELELKIKNAAESYYKDGSSDLTDEEFDKLVEQLKSENPNSEVLTTGWGYNPESDDEICKHLYHRIEGISDKRKSFDSLDDDQRYYVSAKFDGISCVAYYKNGEFVKALTRGNGFSGSLIENYEFQKNVGGNFTGYIRGEMLISNENYKKYDNGKSARNYSAGCIAKKDASTLDFIPYTKYYDDHKLMGFPTTETYRNAAKIIILSGKELKELGIKVVEKYNLNNGYIYDGVVIQPYSCYPTHMIAIKVSEAKNSTKVTSIEWQTGRTGKITPVIHFEPLDLAGAKISKASFGSYRLLVEKKLGVGSEVVVTRVGDVIPQITEILTQSAKEIDPPKCSACGSTDVRIEGAHAYCNNPDCILKSTSVMLARMIQCKIKGKGFQFNHLNKVLSDNKITLEKFLVPEESRGKVIDLILEKVAKPKQVELIRMAIHDIFFEGLNPGEVAYVVGLESPRGSYITKEVIENYHSDKSDKLNQSIESNKSVLTLINSYVRII